MKTKSVYENLSSISIRDKVETKGKMDYLSWANAWQMLKQNYPNAVPIDKVTSTDVNKTIQRSTAKAIAMHGLGLTLWTGEDVPEMVTTKTKKPSKPALIELKINDDNWSKVMKYVAENKDLGLPKIVEQLSRKYNVTSTIKSGISKAIKTK